MRIIILGAGRVGENLARYLALEDNDITLVDLCPESLQAIQERCDVRTVVGNSAHPSTLEKAGIEDADMVVAVTNSDEINMIACHMAAKLYHTPTKIARIRTTEFTPTDRYFCPEVFDINQVISPENIVSDFIQRVIMHPGTLQVLEFAEGRLLLAVVRAEAPSPLIGHPLSTLNSLLPGENQPHIIAIYRNEYAIPVTEKTVIAHNDEIFFLSASHQIDQMIGLLRYNTKPYQRIMIAGGGNIGMRLSKTLEQTHSVKVIEKNHNRAIHLANLLQQTIVLEGSASDKTLLQDENIDETNVFCALTNDDEANIMASLLAKKLGVPKVMTLINHSPYVELIEGGQIDIVISPQQTTLSGFLRHIRKGDIVQVHTLRRGAAEAIEIIAHGDSSNSKVVGKKIKELNFPKGVAVGAVVRENKVIMATPNLQIENEDHVILFVPDVNKIHEVEKMFQVALTFF